MDQQLDFPKTCQTPPAAARFLGVAINAVLAAIRRGDLVAADLRRPGSKRPRYRIAPDDLRRYFYARTAQKPAPAAGRQARFPEVPDFERG